MHTQSAATSGKGSLLLFLAVLGLALALRVYRVGWQSTWYDEQFSIVTSSHDLRSLTQSLVRDFVQPPFHSYLLHYWMAVFGYGDVSARMLSVIAGTAAVGATYALTKRLFPDRFIAFAAGVLMAVSQLGVDRSQEARCYALATFLTAVCALLWVKAVETTSWAKWWAFTAAAILLLYTHYYSIAVFAALANWAWLYRKRLSIPVTRWVSSALVTGLALLAWLNSGVLQSYRDRQRLQTWGFAHWYTPYSSVGWFNNSYWAGLSHAPPFYAHAAGAILFLIPAAIAVYFACRLVTQSPELDSRARNLWLLVILFTLCLGLPFAASLWMRMPYNVRYVSSATVPYYILVAYGLASLRQRWVKWSFLLAILIHSLGALHANYFIPSKTDYRGTVAYVMRQYHPGDCAIFGSAFGTQWRLGKEKFPLYWQAYRPDESDVRVTTVDDALSSRTVCSRIWLLWDENFWFMTNLSMPEEQKRTGTALQSGFTKSRETGFIGVAVALYLRSMPR